MDQTKCFFPQKVLGFKAFWSGDLSVLLYTNLPKEMNTNSRMKVHFSRKLKSLVYECILLEGFNDFRKAFSP